LDGKGGTIHEEDKAGSGDTEEEEYEGWPE